MWKGRDNGADLALPTWDPRLSLSPRLLGESRTQGRRLPTSVQRMLALIKSHVSGTLGFHPSFLSPTEAIPLEVTPTLYY